MPDRSQAGSPLFEPLTVRDVTMRNRVGVSPMCQYGAQDGVPNDWHLVHLGSRAVGGAGLVIAEATAISPEGRITPDDAGIWSDDHVEPWARVTRFLTQWGGVPAIQLAHAGRKASCWTPWLNKPRGTIPAEQGGWQPIAPSAIAYDDRLATPTAMNQAEIDRIVAAFAKGAERALAAGFRMVEVHAAHGYLLHSFHSPLANQRDDRYGGSFENRTRLIVKIVRAIRKVWPDALPLAVRLSCTDWIDRGWTLDESVALSRVLKDEGVDLIDCSSGGAAPGGPMAMEPGAQVPFAERIRREADVRTMAVGGITKPRHAAQIVADHKADVVLLARELLRDPYWPVHAAIELGCYEACPYIPRYDHWVKPTDR